MSEQQTYMIYALADYVAGLSYEDLPPRAVEVSKQCILDSYGNMIYGRYCETAEHILAFVEKDGELQGGQQVPLMGEAEGKAPLKTALFAHTMMARCADLDDGYRHAMGHPGSSLVATALTMAHIHGKSGKDIVTAIVAGYDVYARLGEPINPFMYRERGFDATGVCGAVANAAIIGKLSGMTAGQIKDAMGIASLFTGGLIEYQNDGTSGKVMCGGWGALTALRAATLASCGFTGPNAALEGKQAFFQAFRGTSGHMDTSHVLTGLGKDFKVCDIYFKRHACQRGLHATLDAMLELRGAPPVPVDQIRSVDIFTSTFVGRLSNPVPKTAIGAQASAQYTSAIALKYGRMDSEELILDCMEDREVADLAQRIRVVKDDEVQRYLDQNPTHFCAARAVMTLADGTVREKWAPVPLGDAETPFDWPVLKEKYLRLIEGTPFAGQGEERYDMIHSLEDLTQVERLFWL